MKALVTGANGFLGRHVVAELLRRGHAVRALVRASADVDDLGWPPGVEIFRGDLRSSRDLQNAFDGVDVLIHLAAAVSGSDDAQFAAAVVGTEKLLDAMAKSQTNRLVLAGSCSVYAWGKIRWRLSEESALESNLYQRDGYAIAKTWQERVTRNAALQNGWQLTVIRPGYLWGAGNEDCSGIGQRVGRFYFLFGPLRRMPMTHVENAAACFVEAAENPKAVGQTFNVFDRQLTSVWSYAGAVLRGTGPLSPSPCTQNPLTPSPCKQGEGRDEGSERKIFLGDRSRDRKTLTPTLSPRTGRASKRSDARGIRVPLPYYLVRVTASLVEFASNVIFKGKGKLPGLFMPIRFDARFKPLRVSNRKLKDTLGWEPPLDLKQCLDRTYRRPAPASPVAEAATLKLQNG